MYTPNLFQKLVNFGVEQWLVSIKVNCFFHIIYFFGNKHCTIAQIASRSLEHHDFRIQIQSCRWILKSPVSSCHEGFTLMCNLLGFRHIFSFRFTRVIRINLSSAGMSPMRGNQHGKDAPWESLFRSRRRGWWRKGNAPCRYANTTWW